MNQRADLPDGLWGWAEARQQVKISPVGQFNVPQVFLYLFMGHGDFNEVAFT